MSIKSSLLTLRRNPGKYFFILWICIYLFAIVLMAVCIKHQYYLSNNDAFYYLAIAENLVKNGHFMDSIMIPDGPVITPQNGVVFLFIVLKELSLTNPQCIAVIVTINAAALFLSTRLLIKIGQRLGLNDRFSQTCLLCMYLLHIPLYQWFYLTAVNDMLFLAAGMWFLLKLIELQDDWGIHKDGAFQRWPRMMVLGVASVFLIHFRLNALLIPLASMLTLFLLGRWRIIILPAVLLVIMLLSLFGFYYFIDATNFHGQYNGLTLMRSDFVNQIYIFSFQLLPEALFRDLSGGGNFLYLPFYLAMLFTLTAGIRKRDNSLLTVLFLCGMTFVMVFLHGCVTHRYLWFISPFLYMLVLRISWLRPFGYLFIACIILNTVLTLYNGVYPTADIQFWKYVANHIEFKKENMVMISLEPRQCWYFTGIQSVQPEQYQWLQFPDSRYVYLAGGSLFVKENYSKIKKYAEENHVSVSMRNLTLSYKVDNKERLLYELQFTPEQSQKD